MYYEKDDKIKFTAPTTLGPIEAPIAPSTRPLEAASQHSLDPRLQSLHQTCSHIENLYDLRNV